MVIDIVIIMYILNILIILKHDIDLTNNKDNAVFRTARKFSIEPVFILDMAKSMIYKASVVMLMLMLVSIFL